MCKPALKVWMFCANREKMLSQDLYLVPYALLELAVLQTTSGRLQDARITLDKAR